MKITQDIRDYASKHKIKDIKIAIDKGMREKSKQFADSGNNIYIKNIHDLVHDGTGHQFLVLQIHTNHYFHQDAEQEHARHPQTE